MNNAYQNQLSGSSWDSDGEAEIVSGSTPDQDFFFPDSIAGRVNMRSLEQQMIDFASEIEDSLQVLRREYVFEDPERVLEFLNAHRALMETLIEAVPFLRKAFGGEVSLQLQLFWEEAPETIRGVALWGGSVESARESLKVFDDIWWARKFANVSERLVFDVQFV